MFLVTKTFKNFCTKENTIMFEEIKSFKFIYWLIIAIFMFLFIFLLVKLFPLYGTFFSFLWKLISPFIVACFIAYLLYPIIERLHQHHIKKPYAILLIYLMFFGGTAYLIYRLYPAIILQLRDLNEHIPELIRMYENIISNLYESTSFLPEAVHDQIDQIITKLEKTLEEIIAKLLSGFTKIIDIVFIITIIPVLVFYFLKDYHKIKQVIKLIIPIKYHQKTSKLLHAIDERLGNYIRGQLLVSLFVSFTSLLVFHFLEIKYALLLAIIMGLTNVIPYFGPIIGAVPVIAITVTVSTKLVLIVIVSIIIIQIIESNFLSPYIVGKSINIHPVTIIFALLLGGQLSGVLGMLLAVPILTILKEIVIHLLDIQRVH